MSVKLEATWLAVLKDEFEKDYMKSLKTFLVEEKKEGELNEEFKIEDYEQENKINIEKIQKVFKENEAKKSLKLDLKTKKYKVQDNT